MWKRQSCHPSLSSDFDLLDCDDPPHLSSLCYHSHHSHVHPGKTTDRRSLFPIRKMAPAQFSFDPSPSEPLSMKADGAPRYCFASSHAVLQLLAWDCSEIHICYAFYCRLCTVSIHLLTVVECSRRPIYKPSHQPCHVTLAVCASPRGGIDI